MNLTCKNFNTDIVLWWILILEEYGPDIDYIPGQKNIAADALSQLLNNRNQDTTHESTYTTEKMSELYNVEVLPEVTFSLSFKLVDCYQREDPILTETNMSRIFKGFFLWRHKYYKTCNV